eukprot:g667.t1
MPAYEGETAVGRRVEIEWPEEEEGEPPPWYGGLVKQYDEEQGYLVLYDDGDEAVIAHSYHGVQWEEMNEAGSNFRFVEDGDEQAPESAEAGQPDEEGEVQVNYDAPQQEQIDSIVAAYPPEDAAAEDPARPDPLEVDKDLDLDLDYEGEEEDEQDAAEISRRSYRSPQKSAGRRSAQSSPMKSPTVARAATASRRRRGGRPSKDESEWFYYDRESLLEQRQRLEDECRQLEDSRTEDIKLLTKHETESAEIKRKLHEASTKAALVGLGTKAYHIDHYKDRSKQREGRERGHGRGSGSGSGSESGHEYVIELKLKCDELRRGMLEVERQAQREEKQVAQLERQLSKASTRMKKTPMAERQTLTEARMEVVLLLDEKNKLQNQHNAGSLKAMEQHRELERTKRRLEEKLEQLCDQVESERDAVRRLERAKSHEEARCIPLREHERKLARRLKEIKGADRLLRAAFDQYKQCDSGLLAQGDVLDALEHLSAAGSSVPQEELRRYLDLERKRRGGRAGMGDDDEGLDFDMFCQTFQHLAWR